MIFFKNQGLNQVVEVIITSQKVVRAKRKFIPTNQYKEDYLKVRLVVLPEIATGIYLSFYNKNKVAQLPYLADAFNNLN